jgi:thiol-disulfide isomerase/thioredoxin
LAAAGRAGAEQVTGVVMAAGKPVKGAEVMLGKASMSVNEGRFYAEAHPAVTDGAGKYTLGAPAGAYRGLALADEGWGDVQGKTGEAAAAVVLQPWARVEGRLMKGPSPLGGAQVRLSPLLGMDEEYSDTPAGALRVAGLSAKTDENGRFSFPRVVGAQYQFYAVQGAVQAFRWDLRLKAGETRPLALGGSGRRVVGKVEATEEAAKLPPAKQGELVLPRPTLVHPANWDTLTKAEKRAAAAAFEATPLYRAWADRPTTYAVEVRADGTFEAVDVPAGEYTLIVITSGPVRGGTAGEVAGARGTTDVSVPAGEGNAAVDAGVVRLQRVYNPQVGEAAPAFDAAAIEGDKRIDLKDYRGKFVLVDFWATWCGPCIELGKHLERVVPTIAGAERLVVVDVSLDDRVELPREYGKLHPSPFVQGYGGIREKHSGWEAFGVTALPSLWLISPEGKVVMRTGHGDGKEMLEWMGTDGKVERGEMSDALLDKTLTALVGDGQGGAAR